MERHNTRLASSSATTVAWARGIVETVLQAYDAVVADVLADQQKMQATLSWITTAAQTDTGEGVFVCVWFCVAVCSTRVPPPPPVHC